MNKFILALMAFSATSTGLPEIAAVDDAALEALPDVIAAE